jgi:hypothetical protein
MHAVWIMQEVGHSGVVVQNITIYNEGIMSVRQLEKSFTYVLLVSIFVTSALMVPLETIVQHSAVRRVLMTGSKDQCHWHSLIEERAYPPRHPQPQ